MPHITKILFSAEVTVVAGEFLDDCTGEYGLSQRPGFGFLRALANGIAATFKALCPPWT